MTPTPPSLDVLATTVRRVEARVAMLEDAVQVHGPPPKRPTWTNYIPELDTQQRRTLWLVIALMAVSAYTATRGHAD